MIFLSGIYNPSIFLASSPPKAITPDARLLGTFEN